VIVQRKEGTFAGDTARIGKSADPKEAAEELIGTEQYRIRPEKYERASGPS
jgi:hypothetical protein